MSIYGYQVSIFCLFVVILLSVLFVMGPFFGYFVVTLCLFLAFFKLFVVILCLFGCHVSLFGHFSNSCGHFVPSFVCHVSHFSHFLTV